MAMGGIFTQTYINDAIDFRIIFLDIGNSTLGNTILCISLCPHLVFTGRYSKQKDAGNSARLHFVHNFIQPIYRVLINTRHRVYRIFNIFSLNYKYRIN